MNKETILGPGTVFEMTGKEALLLSLLALTLLLVVLTLILAVWALRALVQMNEARSGVADSAAAKAQLSFLAWLDRRFITAAVPMEEENKILLKHDYDGIHELDNHLPPWWTGLFYATIVFGVFYLLIFHVWHQAPLQAEELAIAQEQAKVEIAAYQAKQADAIDETNVTLSKDAKDVALGKDLFLKNCKVCHGDAGQGGVGPNLTDVYWLHGGDVKDIFKTIKFGVPQKGMISWKATFKPNEMRDLASFIVSLQGTNPPGAKAPQGDEYKPAGAAPAAAPADSAAATDSSSKAVSAL